MKHFPPELINASKKSLGYEFNLSTARCRPLTGREWVYTATDDQMALLYKIEALWTTLDDSRFYFTFKEVHEKDGFDGWIVSAYDKSAGKGYWKRYAGFPGSRGDVMTALRRLVSQIKAQEDGSDA